MKKFLSLVLALIMTMSLVTVSAGAAYTDADNVNYDEAIDVMSKIGVISGYEDGSINPQGSLTRGAAAKIICNLVLGPTEANALKVTDAPYKDVPANSTFAGYISYCKSAGYVSGYADGTFKPGAPLTGYAFMKMLLGTLGLDKTIEGYEGSNWSVNVAKRALKLGLADGLTGTFNGTKTITREEAMLFALNTLTTRTFNYETKGTNITVGDMTVNTGASAAKQIDFALAGTPATLPLYDYLFNATSTKLTRTVVRDDFGRRSVEWKYLRDKIGTYPMTATETFTTSVKNKEAYAALDLPDDTVFSYYVDGVKILTTVELKDDVDTVLNYTGNGIVTEFFYDEADNIKEIVLTQTYVGKVTDVTKNDDGDRIIIVDGREFKTKDFAKNDWIAYTAVKDGASIKSAYKLEKQTGTVTKIVGTDTYYIDGEKYEINKSNTNLSISANVKDKVDFYLDQYGYLVKMTSTSSTASVDDLALVVAGGADRVGNYVKWYKATGTKLETADVTKNYENYLNKLVQYKVDGDKMAVEVVGNYYGDGSTPTYSYTSGSATITVGSEAVKVDAATTFMYVDTSDETAKTYVGIKNAPSTQTAAKDIAIYEKDGVAVLVVLVDASTITNSNALTFVLFNKDAKTVYEDGKTYTTYTTMKNGVQGTLDFASLDFENTNNYDNYVIALKNYSVNSKGVVSSQGIAVDGVDYYHDCTITEPKNGVITLGSDAVVIADNCAVYTISKAGTITAADLDVIVEQKSGFNHYNDIVWTVDKDGEVDTIILCQVR